MPRSNCRAQGQVQQHHRLPPCPQDGAGTGRIGKAAPKGLDVEKWYTSESAIDFASDKPTLLVFWEIWCPHCRREVPKLQATWDKYGDKIQMVGLTKITRSATEEKVTEFIAEEKVTYPTAKENGDLSILQRLRISLLQW